MEQDYLNKIEKVSIPDSLLEGIKNKIETKRITEKRNGNYALAFAFALLFVNAGTLTTYNNTKNSNKANQEVNPFSINESTFIGYE
ncbi:MAG: hypothetical protein ACJAX0_000020 [Flavobacteriales bacterium]